jgi:hypothetical protein
MIILGHEDYLMGPKYAKGQKVVIVPAINGKGNPKYPDTEKHNGKLGVILEYYRLGFDAAHNPRDYYVYRIRLESDKCKTAIPEDALRPLIT